MKNILKNTLAALDKKEKKHFVILIVLDIIISFADILSLAFLLWIIQFYINPEQANHLIFLPSWLVKRNAVLFIAVFVLLFAFKNYIAFLVSRSHYAFISRVAIRISRNNLAHYQGADFSEFIYTDSSAHIRSICFQPFEFCQYMLSGIQQVITQLALILITIIAIIWFNATLFLLLFVILLPPVMIVFYFIKNRLSLAKKNIQSGNERSFQYLLDALKGYVESNIYDSNEFFLNRFIQYRKKFSAHLFNSLALQHLPGRIIEIFAVLGLFILIVLAQWTGFNDSAAVITIGAFMAAAYKIIPGLVKIININGQMKAYEFSLNELQKNDSAKLKKDEKKPADIVSVELKNVHFQYERQPVLHDFSLSIQAGDFIGICGASGKGKTTILNLLLGFLHPLHGEIFYNRLPVAGRDIMNFWPHIAYVRQQGFFMHDTVIKNITLEEQVTKKENLAYALEISGTENMLAKFPEGLEKIITENGKNISGGQQQRIAIARALYKKATLILLDEPFNELEEASAFSLLQHFSALAKEGKMVVMISHDKKSLSFCNKIISLDA